MSQRQGFERGIGDPILASSIQVGSSNLQAVLTQYASALQALVTAEQYQINTALGSGTNLTSSGFAAYVGAGQSVYQTILDAISDQDQNGNNIGPNNTIDQNVYDWFAGAVNVNANTGFYGNFIQDYTIDGYQARYGNATDAAAIAQLSSNQIALNVANDIIANNTIPDIVGLGILDAGAAASVVFNQSPLPSSGDYAGWAGTLLFPYLSDPTLYDDFLLDGNTLTLPAPTGTVIPSASLTITYKNVPSSYDLIASIEESHNAAIQAGESVANIPTALENLFYGPSENVTQADQSQTIADTNNWFQAYYGLPSNTEYNIGYDLTFSLHSTQNINFDVGTLAGETINAGSDISGDPNIIVGGIQNDIIYGTTSGDDLIDGNLGNNTIYAGGGNDIIFGGGTGNNTIYGNLNPGGNSDYVGNYFSPVYMTKDILVAAEGNSTAADAAIGYSDVPSTVVDGSDTIIGGYGTNIMIGGNGTNTFVLDSTEQDDPITYQNGINVIWGGGGTSTYNITGSSFITIVQMDNPTIQKIEALNLTPYIHDSGTSSATNTIIIDPSSSDRIEYNGNVLSGADYGVLDASPNDYYNGFVVLQPSDTVVTTDGQTLSGSDVNDYYYYETTSGTDYGFKDSFGNEYYLGTPSANGSSTFTTNYNITNPNTIYIDGDGFGETTLYIDGLQSNQLGLNFSGNGPSENLTVTVHTNIAFINGVPFVQDNGQSWNGSTFTVVGPTSASDSLFGKQNYAAISSSDGETLTAQSGNNNLASDDYQTTYEIPSDSGAVTIANYGEDNDGSFGVIEFAQATSAADANVTATSDGASYVISDGTGNTVTVSNALISVQDQVGTIQFGDAAWTQQFIVGVLDTGSADRTSIYGDSSANVLNSNGFANFAQGNGGGDTFVYNVGYGQLEIDETDTSATPSNILQLGMTSAQVHVTEDENGNILITDGVAGDQIQIDGEAANSSSGVQSVSFSNGTVWTEAQLIAATLPQTATISGTTDPDTLTGTTGADVFDGGGGADTLIGGGGGDSFIYNSGYGILTIDEQQSAGTPANIVSFGPGIVASDMTATADTSGDVVLTVNDGSSDDGIILQGMMATAGDGVQFLSFADDSLLPIATLPNGSDATLTQSDGYAVIGDDASGTVSGSSNVIQLGLDEEFTLSGDENTVIGGADTNIITAVGDGNSIDGGSGGANIVVTGSNNTINAGTDFAYVSDTGDSNTLQAGAGSNTLVATGDYNQLLGGAGYAVFIATGGDNSFIGSSDSNSNNTVTLNGDYNYLAGGAGGIDFLATGNSNTLIAGTSFNTLEADGSSNVLQGSSGSATLIASAGTNSIGTLNVLIAGSGYTEMDATGNADTLIGGSGTNTLAATGDDNVLTAGTSFALLSADGDGNTLTGGSAINTLIANGDSNIIHAGSSYEEVDVTGDGNTFVAGAGNGDLTVDGDNNHVTGSDNAYWSATITGTGNVVTSGQNTVGVTAETLGNTYSAGDGYMILDYSYAGAVTVNMTAGTATATGTTATDTIAASVSEVHVGFNSTVTAGSDPMLLEATGNNNTLTGGAGDDEVISDGIFNTLAGGAGLNTLEASSGNNVFLINGTGSNIIQNGTSGGSAAVNQMQFLNSITDQDLWFEQSGNDLEIVQIGTNNTTDLQNWFSGVGSQLQSFQDANGLSLSNSDVSTLVTAMASYQSAHSSFNAATASAMPTDTSLHNAIAAAWQS